MNLINTEKTRTPNEESTNSTGRKDIKKDEFKAPEISFTHLNIYNCFFLIFSCLSFLEHATKAVHHRKFNKEKMVPID